MPQLQNIQLPPDRRWQIAGQGISNLGSIIAQAMQRAEDGKTRKTERSEDKAERQEARVAQTTERQEIARQNNTAATEKGKEASFQRWSAAYGAMDDPGMRASLQRQAEQLGYDQHPEYAGIIETYGKQKNLAGVRDRVIGDLGQSLKAADDTVKSSTNLPSTRESIVQNAVRNLPADQQLAAALAAEKEFNAEAKVNLGPDTPMPQPGQAEKFWAEKYGPNQTASAAVPFTGVAATTPPASLAASMGGAGRPAPAGERGQASFADGKRAKAASPLEQRAKKIGMGILENPTLKPLAKSITAARKKGTSWTKIMAMIQKRWGDDPVMMKAIGAGPPPANNGQ